MCAKVCTVRVVMCTCATASECTCVDVWGVCFATPPLTCLLSPNAAPSVDRLQYVTGEKKCVG